MNNIYYIVKLKNNFKMPLTTISKEFCGKILRTEKDYIIFELNASNAIVIIPLKAIYYMAPSSILWKSM